MIWLLPQMIIQPIPMLTDNYAYLLVDPALRSAAVIDPAEAGPVLEILRQQDLQLSAILNTHHHADHVGGNEELLRETACTVVCSQRDLHRIPGARIGLEPDGDFRFGSYRLESLGVPGHTRGHCLYYCAQTGDCFTGDTLFAAGCGRLFEGTADELFVSLQKIKTLPPETRLWFGHEYARRNLEFSLAMLPGDSALRRRFQGLKAQNIPSVLADERETNLFLRASDVQELTQLRLARDRF